MKNEIFPAAARGKRIFLLLFSILLLAGLFGFAEDSFAEISDLLISEAAVGIENANNEFVEIYNPTNYSVNLVDSGFKLKLINSSNKITNKKISWVSNVINPKGFFLFGTGNLPVSFDATYSSPSLTSKGGIMISDENDIVVDEIEWIEMKTNQAIKREFLDKNSLSTIIESPDPQNSSWKEDDGTNDSKDDDGVSDSDDKEALCDTDSDDVTLNEIYPYTEDSSNEFVELFNNSETCVDISGWIIKDAANHKYTIPDDTLLPPDGYFYIEKNLYLNNDGDTAYLLNKAEEEKDKCTYEKADKDMSYGFAGSDWIWTPYATPGKENKFEEEKIYPSEIYLNEILPYPKKGEEEYIEIFNNTEEKIDLSGWKLKDAAKSGKGYVFPNNAYVKAGGYMVTYKHNFNFALNNSGAEKVYLFNPNGEEVSSTFYSGSKKGVSYNFDGEKWRWSNKLTPGEKNKFNNIPEVDKKTDKKFYVNVYANFSADGYDKDKDKLRFTWDFGDGHKSYKKETRHKYEKAGKYTVTLKVSDGSEDKLKIFKIEVKKYPKRSVKIMSVSPNPKGKDSENEFIVVKNNSTKKVNLKDWGIATGRKKLSNHPIREDFIIKPGKNAIITRADSKFTLHNKKSKVELRYPDGKVASKLKYDKKKESVAEDEIYTKESGHWAWLAPKTETNLALAAPVEVAPQLEETASLEIIMASGKNFTENPEWGKNILADSINQKGYVLGTSTFRPHTARSQKEKSHFEIIFSRVNSGINFFFNYLIKYLH